MEKVLNLEQENASLATLYATIQNTSLRQIISQPVRKNKFGVPRPLVEFTIERCAGVSAHQNLDIFVWNFTMQNSFNFATRRNFLMRDTAFALGGEEYLNVESGLKLDFNDTQLMITTLARVAEEALEKKNLEPTESNVAALLAFTVYHSVGLLVKDGSYSLSKKYDIDPTTEEFYEYLRNGFSISDIVFLLTEYGKAYRGKSPLISAEFAREYNILDLPHNLAVALITV